MRRLISVSIMACLPLCEIYAAGTSSYSGQETREIKALSDAEIAGLLAGKGMGYAKAAELNGFPGPLHVLELAETLGLSQKQRNSTQVVFNRMEREAKKLGAELVEAERDLDAKFRNKNVDEKALGEILDKIGRLQAQLRAVHLNAHLEQRRLLTDEQITKYAALRGYDVNQQHGHHHHQHKR